MSLADRIAARLGYVRKGKRTAMFSGAAVGRLTQSWTTDPGAINTILRSNLRTLRARARQLTRSEAYAAKFVGSCVHNIAGPAPFRLQAKIKRPRGALDPQANKGLEEAWFSWSRKGQCEVTRQMSLDAVHRMIVRTLARDGECLIRLHRGRGEPFGPYGLRLQVLDIDRLDEEKNETLAGGASIKMGVEVDAMGMPVAYHLLRKLPGEVGMWGSSGVKEYDRLPAGEVLHLFVPEWPEQVRGVPWLHPAMVRMWHLAGFEEAAVISARVGASKMGFYVSPDGLPPPLGDATDSKGRFVEDAEPGVFGVVPTGYDLKTWDPGFPDQAVEPFLRTTLRGIAAGLGVAYHSLANDPSNVNYSTARVALLEERDMWGALQAWYIDHVCRPIYDAWRSAAVSVGMLPAEAIGARYEQVRWQAKTWDWVDPLKDRQAQIEALKAGLTSRTRIAAQSGEDIEDIFDEIAEETALAEAKGIEFESEGAEKETETESSGASGGETDEADDDSTEAERRLRAIA